MLSCCTVLPYHFSKALILTFAPFEEENWYCYCSQYLLCVRMNLHARNLAAALLWFPTFDESIHKSDATADWRMIDCKGTASAVYKGTLKQLRCGISCKKITWFKIWEKFTGILKASKLWLKVCIHVKLVTNRYADIHYPLRINPCQRDGKWVL